MLRLWRRRRHVSSKYRSTCKVLQGVISQKIQTQAIFTHTQKKAPWITRMGRRVPCLCCRVHWILKGTVHAARHTFRILHTCTWEDNEAIQKRALGSNALNVILHSNRITTIIRLVYSTSLHTYFLFLMLNRIVHKYAQDPPPPNQRVGYHYGPLARQVGGLEYCCWDWALWNNRAPFLHSTTNQSNRMYIKVKEHFWRCSIVSVVFVVRVGVLFSVVFVVRVPG
jgi:hypothetical protein